MNGLVELGIALGILTLPFVMTLVWALRRASKRSRVASRMDLSWVDRASTPSRQPMSWLDPTSSEGAIYQELRRIETNQELRKTEN